MANVDTDVIVHIIRMARNLRIGQSSIYTTEVHPGTNNLIQGWKWDERVWPTSKELEAVSYAPSIWDPSLSLLEETVFQSGYGDNNDLILLDVENVLVSGTEIWAPKINHGYYYIYNEESYLFSDQHLTEDLLLSNVVSGIQYHTLSADPKPTIPIQVRNYTYDSANARYMPDTIIRKKLEFTTSGTEPEFLINAASPPTLTFNEIVNTTIGDTVSGITGTTDPDDIEALEVLGYSKGTASQEFFSTYSPIDRSQPVEVWSWRNSSAARSWTIISDQEEFTAGNNDEVYIDYDYGIIRFGDYSSGEGSGAIPLFGSAIGIYYTKSFEIKYEPKNTINYILVSDSDANINPLYAGTSSGFIQLSTLLPDPSSVELTSALPQENPFIISLGNFVGPLFATVKDSSGLALSGQRVVFEILDPAVGTFGGTAISTRSITNSEGIAQTLYNSPPTVSSLGRYADSSDVSTGGGQTVIEIDGLINPSNVSNIYLYKVHKYDEALGILETELSDYYTDYLDEENISNAEVGTQEYEQEFREYYGLSEPLTYAADDLTTGKKTILLTSVPNGAMHPHEGTEDPTVLIPLAPISAENIGTETNPVLSLTYDTELDIPGTGDTKAYFGVGDALTSVRAYVEHPRTGTRIYSNTITLKVSLSLLDTVNGTYYANALSDIPDELLKRVFNMDDIDAANINATNTEETLYNEYLNDKESGETYEDWFRRTRASDTAGLDALAATIPDPTLSGLIEVEPQTPTTDITIPLGFRLKSSGITAASLLDQITYIDPNDDT